MIILLLILALTAIYAWKITVEKASQPLQEGADFGRFGFHGGVMQSRRPQLGLPAQSSDRIR